MDRAFAEWRFTLFCNLGAHHGDAGIILEIGMTNEEAEKFILDNLPSSYGRLVKKVPHHGRPDDFDRTIDKALQRLRRRGRISFIREGRNVLWSVVL